MWRPTQSSGFFLVDENIFRVTIAEGYNEVIMYPDPSNILSVQPSDVVGYYTSEQISRGMSYSRQGIQLDTDTDFEDEVDDIVVQYYRPGPGPRFNTPRYDLFTASITAAPMLSVMISK